MKAGFTSLPVKIAIIDEEFRNCPDLIKQKVCLKMGHEAYFIYFEGLINAAKVQHEFINPILLLKEYELSQEETLATLLPGKVQFCRDRDSIISALLSGDVVFVSENLEFGIAAGFEVEDYKDSMQPKMENSIYPSDFFQEQLISNLGMLRKKIKSSRLKFKIFEFGKEIKEKIVIVYFEGITSPGLLDEVDIRLARLSDKNIINFNEIEAILKDNPYSPFPQYQLTTRLDLTVAALLNGRLAILRNGNPVGILTPANFFAFFLAPDDLHGHWLLALGMRLLRIISTMAVVLLPGIYIALSAFHYQFLNLNFLIALAESRVRVPVLPIIEVLFMEFILTIIYELDSRLSSHSKAWLEIIGGLLLTGTLLMTGIVSNILLIISALTLLISFLTPVYHLETLRLLRLIFIVFAGLFGMLGVAIGASLTFSHLIIIRSLGQPYLQPFIPSQFKNAMPMVFKTPYHHLRRKGEE